ncbi:MULTISPECIES: hypothetical protein [Acidovorax]|nr:MULTISPECIES: hypothetical protein [Acidovorax]
MAASFAHNRSVARQVMDGHWPGGAARFDRLCQHAMHRAGESNRTMAAVDALAGAENRRTLIRALDRAAPHLHPGAEAGPS